MIVYNDNVQWAEFFCENIDGKDFWEHLLMFMDKYKQIIMQNKEKNSQLII